jgi:hypothetical protein
MQTKAANDAIDKSRVAKYRDGSSLAPRGATRLTLLEADAFQNDRLLAAMINSGEVLSESRIDR